MGLDYRERDVVVTGATGTLGAAVARLLLNAGAIVHIPARDPGEAKALYGAAGERARIVEVRDLADEGSVEALYAPLTELWASIHVAGGFAMGRVDDVKLAGFRSMLDMNAVSAFLCSREAIKKMRGRGGRIVNVAAQPGVEPRRGAGMAAYATSKAAVAALTLALAEEVAGDGIWVNAVAPSIMDTPANRKDMPKADHAKWPKVEEVAATIAFLASPQNMVTRAALVPVYGKS
jgi:NAD(P)-dependent dehydrogenase (short-subunit alcohol dehydrogenase family)